MNRVYFDDKCVVCYSGINFLRKKDASRLAGLADGTFWYSSVSKPVGGYLKVKDFSINDVLLGDLILNTQSNNKRKFLVLDGYVKPSKKSKTIEFNGTVSLDKKNSMNMFLNFNGQDCNILNPYISSISNNKGNIILISSINAHRPVLGQTNYSSTKNALIAFNRCLAIENSIKNIGEEEYRKIWQGDPFKNLFTSWEYLSILEESNCIGQETGWTINFFTLQNFTFVLI